MAAVAAAMAVAHAGTTDLVITYGQGYSRPLYVGGSSLWQGRAAYATGFLAQRSSGDALPSGHTDPFLTFCIDASNTLTASGSWRSGSFPNPNVGSPAWQPDGICRAASLYNQYVTGASVVNPADSSVSGNYASKEAAALQLAIWEVLYEPANTGYNVTSGAGFRVGSNGDLEALANLYLGFPGILVPDVNITTTFWDAVDPGNNQDLIGPFTPVPEPGTVYGGLALMLPLLAGGLRKLRFVHRRS